MTAALGEAAVGGEAASAEAIAPTSSAPTGTARASAGSAGTKPRNQKQLRRDYPKQRSRKSGGSSSARSTAASSSTSSKKSKGPALVTLGRKAISPSKGRLSRSGARQLLVAEFVLCTIILALSPLTDKHRSDTPAAWMKRGTAICALFIVLGLVSAGGQKAAKVAASFGGIATVALLVADRDIFVTIAQRFGTTTGTGPEGPPGEAGIPVAGALGTGGETGVPTNAALGGG